MAIEEPGVFVAFIAIKYCFDTKGDLQTDLHIKETDSRSYLSFGSQHPNHIFSGIVYSQCLRLRRIINNTDRLHAQLLDLKDSFIKSKYPPKMVNNIIEKVKSLERNIYYERPVKEPSNLIRVVTTSGSDSDIVDSVKRAIPHLSRTRSFSGSDASVPISTDERNSASNQQHIFSFVNKTAASLHNKLVKVKHLAFGKKFGSTFPCLKHGNCKCCKIINASEDFIVNGKKVKAAGGNCVTYNIIYLILCKKCKKFYVGRSIKWLRTRIVSMITVIILLNF